MKCSLSASFFEDLSLSFWSWDFRELLRGIGEVKDSSGFPNRAFFFWLVQRRHDGAYFCTSPSADHTHSPHSSSSHQFPGMKGMCWNQGIPVISPSKAFENCVLSQMLPRSRIPHTWMLLSKVEHMLGVSRMLGEGRGNQRKEKNILSNVILLTL